MFSSRLRSIKEKEDNYNQAGHHGTFQGQAFSHILCFSSSLKYLDNSIWCTVPKLFCRYLKKKTKLPLSNKPVNPKGNQCWIFIGRIDAEAEVLILWLPDMKRRLIRKDSHWERLKAGGEGDDREQGGYMASLIQWTWVWASSGRWWRTGMPGVLQYIGSGTTEWLNNNKVYIFKSMPCYEFWQLYWPV